MPFSNVREAVKFLTDKGWTVAVEVETISPQDREISPEEREAQDYVHKELDVVPLEGISFGSSNTGDDLLDEAAKALEEDDPLKDK